MKIITKTQYTLLALLTGLLALNAAMAMQPLSDEEMGAVSGQALLMMDMREGIQGQSEDYNFYRAGLDAIVEINANFEKLQLGCGGVNGPGCDLDIDHLSLSGQLNPDGTCANGGGPRAACDAILTRPFFEFAIKNDHTPHREIVGFRLSAENSKGLLTAGDQQPGSQDPGNLSGINVFSGFMKLGELTGVAQTQARTATYDGLDRQLKGRIIIESPILSADPRDFTTNDYTLNLGATNANVTVAPVAISGSRLESVELTGSATIDPLPMSGEIKINTRIAGIGINLTKNTTGQVAGLTADPVPINQSLKFIHKINVDSPFSLSMQSENVWWPEAEVSSQRGWWMAFEDEIDIGEVTPEAPVPIDDDILLEVLGPTNVNLPPDPVVGNAQQLQNSLNCGSAGPSVNCALKTGLTGTGGSYAAYNSNNTQYYKQYGVYCNGAINCATSSSLAIGTLEVPKVITNFALEDLKLSGQNVTANCYGDARFC